MINMRKHLASKEAFSNWLISMYTFYLINRLVDTRDADKMLAEMHQLSDKFQVGKE